jgi:hypothetical protein
MQFLLPLTLAAAISSPLSVVAQDKTKADPAWADEHVPTASYRSVFTDYLPLQEETESPDKVGSAANREAEMLGGHAGQIKIVDSRLSQCKTNLRRGHPCTITNRSISIEVHDENPIETSFVT